MITRTIREQVTDQIREQVVAGAFAPGQPLRETEVAQRFGVSRGPVRDAFLQLAQEGVLAYEPNRGVTVNPPPIPEDRELIVSLRQQIECAVVSRGLSAITQDSKQLLQERLDTLARACADEDLAAVAKNDVAFHEALLLGCGGHDLLPVWKSLCARMLMSYERLDDYDAVRLEHAAILQAVREGDAASVVSALKANVQ